MTKTVSPHARWVGPAAIGLLVSACGPELEAPRELDNADRADRAGAILELTDERPRTIFLECEGPRACDIELRASLLYPSGCALLSADRACGVGGSAPISRTIATLTVTTPTGALFESAITLHSESGGEVATVIEPGTFSRQEPGVYFVDVTRAAGVSEDVELLLDARWDDSAETRPTGLLVVGGLGVYRRPVNDSFLEDTLVWNGQRWQDVTPTERPSARAKHGVAYDAARERVVLFGGWLPHTGLSDETWEWDGTRWELVSVGQGPSPRRNPGLVYDASREKVVLIGGHTREDAGDTLDVWEWDGQRWQDVTAEAGPAPREVFAFTYDASRERAVVFGGLGADGSLGDTWEWDGERWHDVTPETGPAPRGYSTLAYDPIRERVVLFGGGKTWDVLHRDTWEWDGTSWHELDPEDSPSARAHTSLAFDPVREQVVVFGGRDDRGHLGDMWAWDGARWDEIVSDELPSPRLDHGLVVAPLD